MTNLRISALHDMWAFCDLIDFQGGAKNFDPFHTEMSEHYTKVFERMPELKKDPSLWLKTPSTFVNLVPRGYLKSTVNTVLYCLWRVYRNPNIRICINTNNQALAYSFIRQLRVYFEDTELLDRVWNCRPHFSGRLVPNMKTTKLARGASIQDTEAADNKIIWNNVALQVLRPKKLKEPTITIGSANSINTGNHYDLVIFDDVVDFDNSKTYEKREKLRRWMNEVESQLDPMQVSEVEGSEIPLDDIIGIKMLNGTPYYDDDLYSSFMRRADDSPRISVFKRNIYRNGVDASDGYNWSSRFNDAIIADIKERIDDPRVFAAQYELKSLEQFEEENEQQGINISLTKSKPSLTSGFIEVEYDGTLYRTKLFAAADLASKFDFNVLIIGAFLKPELFYIADALLMRGKMDKFLNEAYHLVQEVYPVQTCYLEANGVGGGAKTALTFIHKLKHQDSFKPLRFTEIWQTESKDVRIAFAMRFLRDCQVVVGGGVAHNSEFIKQLKHTSGHDDVPDCLATCLYRFPKNIIIDNGERRQRFQYESERRIRGKLRNLYELMGGSQVMTQRGIINGHF